MLLLAKILSIFSLFFLSACWPTGKETSSIQSTTPIIKKLIQLKIPGSSNAYNPSIEHHPTKKDHFLLSLRIDKAVEGVMNKFIGLIELNKNLELVSSLKLLNTRKNNPFISADTMSRSEDARLFYLNNQLHVIYNDALNELPHSKRIMFLGEIHFSSSKNKYSIKNIRQLSYPKYDHLSQKNWTPFSVGNELFLSYFLTPHIVLKVDITSGLCEETYRTKNSSFKNAWSKLGNPKGGSQVLYMEKSKSFLAFSHSFSGPDHSRFYTMGAYEFESTPPFRITKFSPAEITHPSFYNNEKAPAGHKVIFPSGLIERDRRTLLLTYGRNDKEAYLAIINKKNLLNFLVSQ